MKSLLRFCLFVIVPLLWFGVAINATLAQQVVSVSPEVKADMLRRLEASKNFQVPKRDEKGGIGKMSMRVCNNGPRGDDFMDQREACTRYLFDQNKLTSATLDELMPSFKGCALFTDSLCTILVDTLYRTGHTGYALAVMEYAPNCGRSCRHIRDAEKTGNGFRLTLVLGWQSNPIATIAVVDETDVMQILEESCHHDGTQSGCQSFAQAGGSYVEADRLKAAQDRENDTQKSLQTSRDQFDKSTNRGPGFMSNLSDALTQAQQQQGATIENANAQQQANLQAMAEAKQRQQQQQQAAQQQQQAAQQKEQQQRQQQEQARLTAEQNARTAQPTAAQSTATQSTATQPCTDMTSYVRGTAKVGSDGWVSGSLTNNSGQNVHVFYTFKVNGAPSNNMANAGSTTINAGQTVGGEGHGLYSTTADKNPGQIYWYAVLKWDHDQGKSCGNSHTW